VSHHVAKMKETIVCTLLVSFVTVGWEEVWCGEYVGWSSEYVQMKLIKTVHPPKVGSFVFQFSLPLSDKFHLAQCVKFDH